MKYPILTYGLTEYTASAPDKDGNIEVYAETVKDNDFANITVRLPQEIIIDTNKFSESEVNQIMKHIHDMNDSIVDYVIESESCANLAQSKEVHYAGASI